VTTPVFAQIPALSFTKPFNGADPLPQTITVASVGTGFNFSRTSQVFSGNSTWLSVSSYPYGCATCPTPNAITVTVTTLATLAPGTYTGQVVFTSQFGAVSLTVPVTLTVTAAASPFFDTLPGQMGFSLQTSGSSPPAQNLQIRNGGTGTLNWTMSNSTSDGGKWLNASATSGTAPSSVNISLVMANLPGGGNTAGTFIGQLVFQGPSNTDPVTIPVSVVIGANVFSQINAISFIKPFGGADPLPQTLTVASPGASFTFAASVSTSKGGNWLSAASPFGCTICSIPQTLSVGITTLPTLAVGSYTGQIVITERFGSMSITVPVVLTVVPVGGTYFDNLPGQMSFSVQTGAAAVTNQDLEIRNGGAGTLNWTASGSTADGNPWLTISAPLGTAPSVVTIGVSVANLPNGGLIAGVFVGQVVLEGAGARVTVPVSVVVDANVFAQVNPINFTKLFQSPLNPLPQTLTIATTTSTALNFTFKATTATGGSWLTVASRFGCASCTTPQTLTVSVNPSVTLAAGTYTGQVVISERFGTMSMTVPVTLTVAPSQTPYFDNLPGQLSFMIKTHSSANPPAQALQIRNAGGGTLSWTLESSTADGGSWLSVSASSGTAPSYVTISVITQSLPGSGLIPGDFIGNLVFRSSGGGSIAVPVSVIVGDNIFSQINGLSFTMAFGGPNPIPQTFTVASNGTDFNFFTDVYTATGGSWLSVVTAPTHCSVCTTPDNVTATVNASSIPGPGTYTGEIVVTERFDTMAVTVPVTLTVLPASTPRFNDVQGQLSFFLAPGGPTPSAQNVLIQNGGLGRLDWTLAAITSDAGSWLAVSATTGTAPSSLTVGITPSGLPGLGLVAGTFTGQLLFRSTTGSSVTIPVTVVVDPVTFVQLPALSFLKATTTSNPLPQTFQVASTSTNFNFVFAASTASGGSWLSVAPSGPQCTVCPTPTSLVATIGASSTLAPGIYVGQILVTSQFSNLVMAIPVSLTVRTGTTGPGPATHFSVTAPSTATAGLPVQFTVMALDSMNNTATTYTDPVHFVTTDASASVPADATLTNGVGTFAASLVTVGTQTITASDTFAASIAGTSGGITVSAAAGLRFISITPCRVLDTRGAAGPFGGPFISGGGSRNFTIPSSACSIPVTAQAYSFNVAVVPHTGLGFLTVWPTGQTQPQVATLNSIDGRIKSNAAIVPAGTGGAVSVFATNDTDVVMDINGYFVPASTSGALAFYPVTPCRLVDTRHNLLSSGPIAGGSSVTLPILSSSCGVPVAAQAYSLNFTAVPSGPVGFLTAYPTGVGRPQAATLNALTGTVTANAGIVPSGTGGSIDVFASNTTNLVVDINGYFAPPGAGGLSLYNLAPCRVLDTRKPSGSLPFNGSINVDVLGSVCGGTPATQAYVFNATVVPPSALGFLTLWPQGTPQPSVATLNALDAAITNNMAIVPTSNTEISAFGSNPTHLILDIFGYFAP
jgi:hypothetical protein